MLLQEETWTKLIVFIPDSSVSSSWKSWNVVIVLQIVKNYNFVTQSQLKEDQEIVKFCRKCISYREKLTGDENEVTN